MVIQACGPWALGIAATNDTPGWMGHVAVGLGLLVLALCLIGTLGLAVANGLWRMRSWPWRLAVALQGLAFAALALDLTMQLSGPVIVLGLIVAAPLAYLARPTIRASF